MNQLLEMRQMVILILAANPRVEDNNPAEQDLGEYQGRQKNPLLEEVVRAIRDYTVPSAFRFQILCMPRLNRVAEKNITHKWSLHGDELPVEKVRLYDPRGSKRVL